MSQAISVPVRPVPDEQCTVNGLHVDAGVVQRNVKKEGGWIRYIFNGQIMFNCRGCNSEPIGKRCTFMESLICDLSTSQRQNKISTS